MGRILKRIAFIVLAIPVYYLVTGAIQPCRTNILEVYNKSSQDHRVYVASENRKQPLFEGLLRHNSKIRKTVNAGDPTDEVFIKFALLDNDRIYWEDYLWINPAFDEKLVMKIYDDEITLAIKPEPWPGDLVYLSLFRLFFHNMNNLSSCNILN